MLDRALRVLLVLLNLFLGINAVIGGVWVIPVLPPEWIEGTPFSSYLIPALALTIVVGGGALLSAAAMALGRWWAPLASMATGAAIVVFELVETTSLSLHVWLQPFFFAFGLVLVVLSLLLWRRHRTAPVRPPSGSHRKSAYGVARVLSILVAGLLVVTSVAGLAFGTRGLYRADPATLPTFLGQDGLTLLVGLPLLLTSMRLARQGSLRGLLLWLGALFYFAYSYSYYLLGPEFNVLYLAYVGIVSMSLYGLISLLLSVDAEAVEERFDPHTPVHLVGGFMMLMALLIGLKWVATIVTTLGSGATPAHKDVVVWVLDLVVALPALFWGGVWLWRRQSLGYLVAGLLLLKATFVGITLVVDTYLVMRWGEPADPMLPAYALIGLGGLALLILYLRDVHAVVSSGNRGGNDSAVPSTGIATSNV